MEIVLNEIFRALGYLLVAGILSVVWRQAYGNARGGKLKEVLWKGFLWCGGIALLFSVMLGDSTCEIQADPVYGGCEQYADDGYEPTTEQRVASLAYFLVLLYVPVVAGALSGDKKS